MRNFKSFQGIITMIEDLSMTEDAKNGGCYKIMTVEDGQGSIVNFVVEPKTYFVDRKMVNIGDRVTGFYNADLPIPLIYPPQFRAVVMAMTSSFMNVKVSYFDSQLVSSDNSLRLNLAMCTQIVLENGQAFSWNPANRELIVLYGATTMSIPAQTTPYKIIVICE
jgi:hypothetical protein